LRNQFLEQALLTKKLSYFCSEISISNTEEKELPNGREWGWFRPWIFDQWFFKINLQIQNLNF